MPPIGIWKKIKTKITYTACMCGLHHSVLLEQCLINIVKELMSFTVSS